VVSVRFSVCDGCGKREPLGRFSNAPDAWFFLEQVFGGDYEDRDWAFCCPNCVAEFLLVRALPDPEPIDGC
jgi:hypothetical protein